MAFSSDPRYSLNAVCPYFTMFPLEFPVAQFRDGRKPRALLDVFCGRGTSLYAAALHDVDAFGIDSSPVAVAIAKAKLARTSLTRVMGLARQLLDEIETAHIPQGEFWEHAYHRSTLRVLCRLRRGLRRHPDSSTGAVLKAILLGALHGPRAKTLENQSYLSNQMPRTYASKPDYSIKYWKRNRMRPPRVDVLSVVQRRAERVLQSKLVKRSATRNVFFGNSEEVESYREIKSPIDLVITSPPYYGLTTYTQDQWIRNWFLGGPSHVQYGGSIQIAHSSPIDFSVSLSRVWDNISAVGADNLRMVVRFGGIESRHADPLQIFRDSLEACFTKWRILTRLNRGTANFGKRQANQMMICSSAVTEHDFYIEREA